MESGWIILPEISKKNQKKKFTKLCKEYYEINIIDLLDDDQEVVCQETKQCFQEPPSPPSLPPPSLSQSGAGAGASGDSSEHEASLASVTVLGLTKANSTGEEEFEQQEQHEEFPK